METTKSPPLYSPPREPSAATVMLCPCLVLFLLVLIVTSIVLTVHFHLYCHTPLAHLVGPSRCPHHI
jgi:hypothetical protein